LIAEFIGFSTCLFDAIDDHFEGARGIVSILFFNPLFLIPDYTDFEICVIRE